MDEAIKKTMTGYQAMDAACQVAQDLSQRTGLLVQVQGASSFTADDTAKAEWCVRLPRYQSIYVTDFELGMDFETLVESTVSAKFGSAYPLDFQPGRLLFSIGQENKS